MQEARKQWKTHWLFQVRHGAHRQHTLYKTAVLGGQGPRKSTEVAKLSKAESWAYQIYIRDVQSPCRHISGNQCSELSLAEVLQYLLTLVLRDVSVQGLCKVRRVSGKRAFITVPASDMLQWMSGLCATRYPSMERIFAGA